MKPDNNIPDIIFQWLENKSFKMLTTSEREIVNAHLTPDEYDDMFLTLRLVSENTGTQYKSTVMESFDRHHGIKVRHLSVSWIWKVAAVVLPIGLMAGFYFLKQSTSLNSLAAIKLTDTVY